MVSKLQKWGNSQGLRISKHDLEYAQFTIGDDLEVIPQPGVIILKKISTKKFELEELIARMPRDYHVAEENFGQPRGKEAW